MTGPLDLDPIKERYAHWLGGLGEDISALVAEVERLRAHMARVHLFVQQVYGASITDNPALAEFTHKLDPA